MCFQALAFQMKTIGIGKHFNFKLHQQNYLDAQIVIAKLIPVENKECIAANYKGLC